MGNLRTILRTSIHVVAYGALAYGAVRVFVFVRGKMMDQVTFTQCTERPGMAEPGAEIVKNSTWTRMPGPAGGADAAVVVGGSVAEGRLYVVANNQLFRLGTAPNSSRLLTSRFADSLLRKVQVVRVSAQQDVVFALTSDGLFLYDEAGADWVDITPRDGIVRAFSALQRGSATLLAAITRTEVLRSANLGRSWERMDVDPARHSPFASVQLASDGSDTILFVSGKSGVLRNRWDSEKRFTVVDKFAGKSVNSIDRGIGSGGRHNVVFVRTIGTGWRMFDNFMRTFGGDVDSWRSRDLGATWERASVPQTAMSWYPWVGTELFDQESGKWLSIARNASDSLLLSTDSEKSWTRVTLAGGSLALRRLEVGEGRALEGVGLTTDGRSLANINLARRCWQDIPLRLPVATVRGFVFSTDAQRQRLYVATDREVFVSADEALTWDRALTMPKDLTINVMLTPLTAGVTADPVLFFATTDGVYMVPRHETTAVRRGLDGQNVTALLFSPLFDRDQTMYAGTPRGVYKSVDGGKTWNESGNGIGATPINALEGQGGSVYAATRRGAFVTYDGGITWTSLRPPFESRNVVAIGAHADARGGNIVLAATVQRLYRLGTGGSWEQMNLPRQSASRTVNAILFASDASGAQAIYLGVLGGGVIRSVDGGSTWTPMRSAERGFSVSHLIALRGSPTVLVAGTPDRGVWIYRETE
jgi:photosystem II stability/assembly factor-like uncharacterized protein